MSQQKLFGMLCVLCVCCVLRLLAGAALAQPTQVHVKILESHLTGDTLTLTVAVRLASQGFTEVTSVELSRLAVHARTYEAALKASIATYIASRYPGTVVLADEIVVIGGGR